MRSAIILVITAFFACNEAAKQPAVAQGESGPLKAPYATEFYDSLQITMDAYYDLTDGLSQGNATYADKWAAILRQHVDSLPLEMLQMDSARLGAIRTATGSISAELTGLLGEKDLEGKRAGFEAVSDMLYDIIQATGLKGKTIYRQYCPMAFNDRGAYWMSSSSKLQNPYFGNGMLGCVELTDSLRY
jgi:Cu(I)/Ag(I) efflux system membrane fusion protein